jgi:HAD superfamily hydrolase (TIGR01484 family)
VGDPTYDVWQPRLVALDIDGTVIRWVEGMGQDNEEIAPAVRAVVHRVLDAGGHVVLASGRSIDGMTSVVDLLGLHRGEQVWVVASNGGVVFRYPPVEVVHEERFDASEAVRAILAEHPTALVAVEEYGVGYRVSHHFPPGELSGTQVVADVDELVAEPVTRVVIRDPDATPEEFVALGRRLGLANTEYVVGWSAWMDLAPVGVSKASGLAKVADALGIAAHETLAMGDGRNDLEMLRWAHRGVAMGQAVDEVKAVADDVTASVEEDGVAVELGRWFPAAAPQP